MNSQDYINNLINLPISESAKQDILDRIDELYGKGSLPSIAKHQRREERDAIGLAGMQKHREKAERAEQLASKVKPMSTSKATPSPDKIGIPSRSKSEPKQEAPKATQPVKSEQPKQESGVTKKTKELIAKHKENIFKAAGNPYKDGALKTLTQGTKKTLDNAYTNAGTSSNKPTLTKADTTGTNKPAPTMSDRLKQVKPETVSKVDSEKKQTPTEKTRELLAKHKENIQKAGGTSLASRIKDDVKPKSTTPTIADRLKKIEEPKAEAKQEAPKPVEKVEAKPEQQKLDLAEPAKKEVKAPKKKVVKQEAPAKKVTKAKAKKPKKAKTVSKVESEKGKKK